MKFFKLFSGHLIPGFGLGTWNSDPGVVGEAVKTAIEIGYRHIDCAFVYRNEAEIGEAFTSLFQDGTIKREDLFVTSKLWNSFHHPDDVEPALNQTLTDLGLSYLDLYLIHWPVVQSKDSALRGGLVPLEDVPIEDTWKALEKCVDKGLVRDIGVSNFSVKKLKKLMATARIKPSVNQVERHPYLQNPELYEYCQANGIHLTAYSPLGTRGVVGGGRPDDSVPHILENEAIVGIAHKHSATPAQVLIAWALACGTSVIPKSTRKERLMENFRGAELVLDADDMATIKSLDLHRRYIDGTFWTGDDSPYTLENLWDEEHSKPKDEL